jgi:hypothetical protein
MSKLIQAIIVSLLVTTQSGPSQSPAKDLPAKLESQISREYRTSFNTTYKRLLTAQLRQDWPAVYRIALPQDQKNVSEAEFRKVHENQNWKLLDFTPTRLDRTVEPASGNANGRWDIVGDLTILEHGKKRSVEGLLTIYLVEGTWYAGEVGILAPLH